MILPVPMLLEPMPRATMLRALTPASPNAGAVVADAERKGFVGVAAISHGGRAEFLSAGGMRPDSRFPICSVTKLFTAVLILREVDRGRITLTTKAASLVPELGSVLGGTTILDLLTHASPLVNMDEIGPKDADGITRVYRDRSARDGEPLLTARRLARTDGTAPGARYAYNNLDFIVLAALLEKVRRISYAALITRDLARPLGLRATSVVSGASLPNDVRRSRSAPLNFAIYSGAGAILSTTRDLVRFGRAILHGPLLSAKSRSVLLEAEPRFGYVTPGSFWATVERGGTTLRVLDRPGGIGDFAVRLELVPAADAVAIVATPNPDYDLGRVYQRRGLSYDLLVAALDAPAK